MTAVRSATENPAAVEGAADHCTTLEVARWLGMAVRSVQLMVDRGELQAWKTPGGHRRISRSSVERWLATHHSGTVQPAPPAHPTMRTVLLIEDSAHTQHLVSLLVREQFPDVELHVADDGIAGLAMAGELQPAVLLVDILLPGIDSVTLLTSLRTHPQFARSQLIVLTALDELQRAPYAFALAGVPVVYKPNLITELPSLLTERLSRTAPLLPSLSR
jgi:excisionase family DNA binding protein